MGLFLWRFVYMSNIHPTLSGVILAFLLPNKQSKVGEKSVLNKVKSGLAPYCNIIILPLFAFCNTAIILNTTIDFHAYNMLSLGIIMALSIGKPLGIVIFSYISIKLGIAQMIPKVKKSQFICVSMLAGIGFTMSIFMSEIAFSTLSGFFPLNNLLILTLYSLNK